MASRHSEGDERLFRGQLADVLPVIEFGVPLATGKPGYVIGLANGEPWLRDALDELRELQRVLP